MPAGLTVGEELHLAMAENRRYRAAIEIALQGLDAARDLGFAGASDVIGDVNATLAPLAPQEAAHARTPWLAKLRRRLWVRMPPGATA